MHRVVIHREGQPTGYSADVETEFDALKALLAAPLFFGGDLTAVTEDGRVAATVSFVHEVFDA